MKDEFEINLTEKLGIWINRDGSCRNKQRTRLENTAKTVIKLATLCPGTMMRSSEDDGSRRWIEYYA